MKLRLGRIALAAALLDVISAAALGATLQLLLVVSNIARIVGGFLGGLIASRSKQSSRS